DVWAAGADGGPPRGGTGPPRRAGAGARCPPPPTEGSPRRRMAEAPLAARAAGAPAPCEIILPAYNGHDALVRCLAALERHTGATHRVWLVDDASPDPRIVPLLRAFARRRPRTELIENESNLGFVGAVNAALARTTGDVVLLNADTEVTAGWIESLERCRDSAPRIGLVCPLSDNATLLTMAALSPLFSADEHDAIAACVRR